VLGMELELESEIEPESECPLQALRGPFIASMAARGR
jgi:hypothetical protein